RAVRRDVGARARDRDRMTRLALCALIAACYRPAAEQPCSVTCDPAAGQACPAGLACDAPPIDMRTIDARACIQGDTRSFFSGVCVDDPGPLDLSGTIVTSPGSLDCMTTSDSRLAPYCVKYGTDVNV